MTQEKKHNLFKKYLNFGLGLLYLLFVSLDFFPPADTSVIKYCFVWGCIAYVLIIKDDSLYPSDWSYVIRALFLTTIADFILLFTSQFVYGISIFCFVQLCYIRRLIDKKIFTYYCLCLLGLILILWVGGSLSPLIFAALIYAVLIFSHLIATFFTHAPVKKRLLQVGIICFIICDISVALYNRFPSYSPIYLYASLTMWTFYAPALYCISHSIIEKAA